MGQRSCSSGQFKGVLHTQVPESNTVLFLRDAATDRSPGWWLPMTLLNKSAELSAELEAIELANRMKHGDMPIAEPPGPGLVAPGDQCHFVAPARFGRRRSDNCGHLVLTGGWLKFRGTLDVSVGWGEVADVQRAGRDIVVSLVESRRLLRFSCYSAAEAACGGVIAQHLASSARPNAVDPHAEYHASV